MAFSQKVPWEFDGLYDPVSYKKELISIASEAIKANEEKLEVWSSESPKNWKLIKEYGDKKLRKSENQPTWGSDVLPILVGGTGVIMYSVNSENYIPALLSLLAIEVYLGVKLVATIAEKKRKGNNTEAELSSSYYNLKRAYFYNDFKSANDKVLKNVLTENRVRLSEPMKQKHRIENSFEYKLEKTVINSNFDTNEEFENCVPRHPTFPSIRKRNALRMKNLLGATKEELPQIDNWRRELEAFTITQTMANRSVPVLLDTDYESYKQNAIWKTIAGATVASLGVLWFNSEVDKDEYSYNYDRENAEENKNLWAGITTFLGVSYAIKHSFRIGSYDDLSNRQAQYKKALKTSYQNYKTDHQSQKASPTCKNTWLEAKDVSREYFLSEDNSWAGFNLHYMQRPLSKISIWGGQYEPYSLSDTLNVSQSIMHQQFQIKAYHARNVSPKAHYPAAWLLYYLPGYIDFMFLKDHQDEHWQEASTIYKTYKMTPFTPVDIVDKTHLLDWEAIQ